MGRCATSNVFIGISSTAKEFRQWLITNNSEYDDNDFTDDYELVSELVGIAYFDNISDTPQFYAEIDYDEKTYDLFIGYRILDACVNASWEHGSLLNRVNLDKIEYYTRLLEKLYPDRVESMCLINTICVL